MKPAKSIINAKEVKNLLFSPITSVPNALNASYLPGLDGLRAISIMFVVVGHISFNTALHEYYIGVTGVNIFFVISGFLITTLLLKEKVKHGKVSFKRFYIRRALRIMPVAYLFLIVLIIINEPLRLAISTKSFLTAFLYLKNIPFKDSGDWYTGHFWSLSIEEQFYIFFPYFIVCRNNKFIVGAILITLIIPIVTYLGFNNVGFFYTNDIIHKITYTIIHVLGRGTQCILVGSLFSILLFKKIIVIEGPKNNKYLSLVLFIIACSIGFPRSFFHVKYLSEFVFPIIISYVILLNLKEKNLFRLFLDIRLIVKIGVLSYSIYIWQQLFTTKDFNLFPFSDTIPVRLFLLFITSYLSYNLFEKYFLKYKSKFKADAQ